MTSKTPKASADYVEARQIAADLRRAISDGVYSPGDKLPSERALSAQYHSARNTARDAVQILIREGLVVSQHGRGSFVRIRPKWMRFGRKRYSPSMRATNDLGPFGSEAAAQGRTPFVDCSSITRIKAPEHVADRLGIDTTTDVVRRENWYYADDEPVQVGVTFSPWAIVEGTPVSDSADMGPSGIYGQFDAKGYPITYIREEISARMPTHDEKTGLRLPDGVPVIDLWHTGYDNKHRPFETTNFVMRADQTALDYEMPVED